MDIFEKLNNIEDRKERAKILENFWLKEKRSDDENITLIRKGIKNLNNGSDKEKITALQIVSRVKGYPISDQFEALFKMFGSEKKLNERKTVDYEDLLYIIDKCTEFLLNDNGYLRLAAANCIDYLRIELNFFDYANLFYDLLSLKNYLENIKDKKKVKTIEYCLDKIWCNNLELAINANLPLSVKKMKITNEGKETEKTKELEDFCNKMVKITGSFIPRILTLRGEFLLKEPLIPYTINISLFQASYEIQKIMELIQKKEVSNELLDRYSKMRLFAILKEILSTISKIEDKKDFVYVDINLGEDKVHLSTLENAYQRFKNIYDGLGQMLQGNNGISLSKRKEGEDE